MAETQYTLIQLQDATKLLASRTEDLTKAENNVESARLALDTAFEERAGVIKQAREAKQEEAKIRTWLKKNAKEHLRDAL